MGGEKTAWNQRLLEFAGAQVIPSTILHALKHPEVDYRLAYSLVPRTDSSHLPEVFQGPYHAAVEALKSEKCVLTQTGAWCAPRDCVAPPDFKNSGCQRALLSCVQTSFTLPGSNSLRGAVLDASIPT